MKFSSCTAPRLFFLRALRALLNLEHSRMHKNPLPESGNEMISHRRKSLKFTFSWTQARRSERQMLHESRSLFKHYNERNRVSIRFGIEITKQTHGRIGEVSSFDAWNKTKYFVKGNEATYPSCRKTSAYWRRRDNKLEETRKVNQFETKESFALKQPSIL